MSKEHDGLSIAAACRELADAAKQKPRDPQKNVVTAEGVCEHLMGWMVTEAGRGKTSTTYQVGDPAVRQEVVAAVAAWPGCAVQVKGDTLTVTWA